MKIGESLVCSIFSKGSTVVPLYLLKRNRSNNSSDCVLENHSEFFERVLTIHRGKEKNALSTRKEKSDLEHYLAQLKQ